MSAYRKLPAQKRRFVDLIVRGNCGSDAVRVLRPHLNHLRARELASRWRALPEVKAAIDERQAEAMEDAGITNAQILLSIARKANVNPKALVWQDGEALPKGAKVGKAKKLHELDDETARCIQALEFDAQGNPKVRFADKLQADKLLGQYKRLFTETHEINLGEKTLEQLAAASWRRPPEQATPAPQNPRPGEDVPS